MHIALDFDLSQIVLMEDTGDVLTSVVNKKRIHQVIFCCVNNHDWCFSVFCEGHKLIHYSSLKRAEALVIYANVSIVRFALS